MKIYNENKTEELINPDLEHGVLYPDEIIKHHEATEGTIVKTIEQKIEEYKAQGKEVIIEADGNPYVVLAYYPKTGGKDVEPIEPDREGAEEAYNEYIQIFVYHPYTDEEYKEYLRRERERICFPVINRGAAWYARLTPEQNEELQAWYQAWLDAPETGIKPETPEWV